MERRISATAVILGALALCLPTAHRPAFADAEDLRVRAVTVECAEVSGRLVAFDAEQLILRGEDGTQTAIPAADVWQVWFDARPNVTESQQVVILSHGDRLAADALEMEGEILNVAWATLPSSRTRVPLAVVRGVVFRGATRASRASDPIVRQILTGRFDSDVLLLADGERVGGELQGFDGREFRLTTPVGDVAVERDRVAAVAMNPELISVPRIEGPHTLVWLHDGSRVTAQRMELPAGGLRSAGDLLQIETVWGESLSVPLSAVARLEELGGRVVAVSSLEPAEYRVTPYLSSEPPLQRDRNLHGGPLNLRGTEYARGLGVTSGTVVTYDLGGSYARFCAVVGIDDAAGDRGAAVFHVEVDGRRVFSSPVVRRAGPPLEIGPVDVRGAETLKLSVDHSEYGNINDLADWANAVLIRAEDRSDAGADEEASEVE